MSPKDNVPKGCAQSAYEHIYANLMRSARNDHPRRSSPQGLPMGYDVSLSFYFLHMRCIELFKVVSVGRGGNEREHA